MRMSSSLCIALIVLIWMTLVILLSFSAEHKIKVVEVEKVVYNTVPVEKVVHKTILPEPEPLPTWEINRMNVERIVRYEEGFSARPYLDTLGYVTIGLGTKLHKKKGMDPEDFPIRVNLEQAETWLYRELASKDTALRKSQVKHTYESLDDERRAIILSMTYQMGTSGVLKFKKMWAALEVGDFELAATEALDSRWASQTPGRAGRHAKILMGERLFDVYKEYRNL